ncbi:MAG: hypothetical protein IJ489_08900 [Clostridia bacterium]|nr:hypothetical protein [Clostridia bacterium]
MESTVLGVVSPVPKGEWSATATYQKLNIVTFEGSVYIAKETNIGIQPNVTNGWETFWMLIHESASFAEDIIFSEDFQITTPFGYFEPDASGSAVVPAEGKSFSELLKEAYFKAIDPKVVLPSCVCVSSELKSYEVGTTVTPSASVTFHSGSYQFDSETGVEADAYKLTDTLGNEINAQTGSFPAILVSDGISYGISASVAYTAGNAPKNNAGDLVPSLAIQAGTAMDAADGTLTGYRNSFYGTLTEKSEITSSVIRSLNASGKALANGSSFSVSVPVGAVRVVIAYPATLRDVSSINDVNGLNAQIKSSFALQTVSVEGADGYTGISYKVYSLDFAEPNDTENTYNVTI